MSAPWPDTLPSPASDSLRVSRPDVRTALEMDNGSIRRIRRSLSAPWHVDGEIWLTPDQKAAFDHFYRFELRDGLWWFTATWIDGLGLTGMAARFREPPRLARASATLWKAAVRFEAVDAAQAVDTQDWPVSNVVSATGIPTDHIAFWLKPDALPDPVGTDYFSKPRHAIPSYHDPSIESYSRSYRCAVMTQVNGFPAIRTDGLGSSGHPAYGAYGPSGYWLFDDWAGVDHALAIVYGLESPSQSMAFGWGVSVENPYSGDIAGSSQANWFRGAAVLYSDGIRMKPTSAAFSTKNPVSFPNPILRVAVLNIPFRHGFCSAHLNGTVQALNLSPKDAMPANSGEGANRFPAIVCSYAVVSGQLKRYGYVLEAVLWRRTLADTEISAVTNHFIDKYAIPL